MMVGVALGACGCAPGAAVTGAAVTGGAATGAAAAGGAPHSAQSYLLAARDAVAAQQPQPATAALADAERLLLDTAPPPSPFGAPEDPTVIRQIARAREAVMYRQWGQAQTYITEALQHPYID